MEIRTHVVLCVLPCIVAVLIAVGLGVKASLTAALLFALLLGMCVVSNRFGRRKTAATQGATHSCCGRKSPHVEIGNSDKG